ncbi:MAG: HD domain-containing protein [Candidatus Paceibacterota bacterium]|jgi:putative hydrolase of HD superfamily
MDKITDLINLLQITRNQPQYGYAVAGSNIRLSNLAEHHYLVTMLGWQLSELVNGKGAKIDVFKVVKFCLLHDIGELFGGDIGMYYAKANPQARVYARQFEEENQKFLSKYFSNSDEVQTLAKEILESESDEAHISKVADYLEVTHYKLFNGQLKKKDIELIAPKLAEKIEKIQDVIAREELLKFVDSWKEKMVKYDSFLDASTDALKV